MEEKKNDSKKEKDWRRISVCQYQLRWQNLSVSDNDNIRVVTASTDSTILRNGILRSMDKTKLNNTKLIRKSGAKMANIKEEVNTLSFGYDELTLVIGGDDCDSKAARSVDHIVNA